MSKGIRVALEKEEELTSEFMDMFAKFIIHNADTISGVHYDIRSCMKYSELSEYLSNMSRLKHNGLKSPTKQQNQKISFNFESKSNTIVFMLDLSPYMLVYNYGCKSFPLKNMQEIIVNLLRTLAQRFLKNKEYSYQVTIYLFSTHKKQVEAILVNELVTDWNIDQLCHFVSLTIEKSRLPHIVDPQRVSIGDLMQLIFNSQQSCQGIKSMIVVSSFVQEPPNPIMLFTPNWYTLVFINTGGNFGSYIVQNKSLYHKLIPGVCFKTKFVFKSRFLENWEMTDRVKSENPTITKPVTEKFRSILFELDEEVVHDIFELVLVFKVEFMQQMGSKIRNGGDSVISSIKDNNRIVLKTYNIPVQSFFYVLRTRYIQGWQPVLTANSLAVQNCKCIFVVISVKLRLPIEQDEMLFYEANRIQNSFKIVIYEILKLTPQDNKAFVSNRDKSEQLNMIEKMDKLISFNFITIVNENLKISSPQPYRQNILSSHLFQQHNQQQIVNYIYNIKQWGKFFKIKRICFKFQPYYHQQALEEFLTEISFIIGKRIVNSIFIKQNENENKGSQKMEEGEAIIRKVMLTKVNVCGNILELELAFLRFPYQQIKNTLESIKEKIEGRKFKKGVQVLPVPNQVCLFHRNQDINNHHMFYKKWTLKFKSIHYMKIFIIYFQSVLRKLNYDGIRLKASEDNIRHHYKIIDVRSCQNQIRELVTFLTLREFVQKNEVLFHFAIPPSFLSIHPFQNQSQAKPIPVTQLINMISQELKKTQKQVISLIDTYQWIHFKLLKSAQSKSPKAVNSKILEIISSLYDVRTLSYPPSFSLSCRELISKYYRQSMKQTLNNIPTPSKLLMGVQLDRVQGDLNLTIAEKQYAFFLCSPFKFIYLQKRDKNLYYKIVNIYYEDIHKKESQKTFIELILQEIMHRINQQVYMKDFKTFLDGNFKGGITKIIDNQEFTHLQSRNIDLGVIFQHCEKYYLTTLPSGTIEEERARKTLNIFTHKLMAVVKEFFPLQRVNHYFQIRNKQEQGSQAPFNIDTSISRNNTELFMRMYFLTSNEQLIDVTLQNLPSLIIKHCLDVIKKHSRLLFKFYLKAKNNNQKSMLFINTLADLIRQLCIEISFQMERSLLYKKGTLAYHLDNFGFLWDKNQFTEVRLFLINKECQQVDRLCKHIENLVMQHEIPIKRVKPFHPEYMIFEENKDEIIQVRQPFLMRVTKGKLDFFYHKSSRFFQKEQNQFKHKIEEMYIPNLNNFINSCVLMEQLVLTYELPLDPYELWMNESVNHSNNKFITTTSKKMTKRNPAISKFLAKKVTSTTTSQDQSPSYAGSTIKIKLSQLYRNYLPLNQRISPNVTLNYIKGNQVFYLSIIHNMKNTYLFEKIDKKNDIIFYFEEQQDQSLIKQISEENKQLNFSKFKNYLVYTAFCLNPFLQPKIIDKLILPHILQALHKQLFDDVSRFLLANHSVIQEFEESFIKRKQDQQKKQFKHEIPHFFHRDHITNYIIQHLQVYHNKVEFKSEIGKKTETTQSHKFIDSLRYVEVVKSQINKLDLTTDMIIDRRMSQPISEYSSLSLPLTGNRIIMDSNPLSNSSVRGSELMSMENLSHHYDQTLNCTWLFNCESPDKSLTEKYGKCLYFLKLKYREDQSKALDQQCSQIYKINYLFTKEERSIDFLQSIKPFLSRKVSTAKNKKDVQSKNYLIFELTQYVGSPHFNKIQDTFFFITKGCISEVHIQTFFFRTFCSLMRESSFLKEEKKKNLEVKDKQYFYKEKAWPALLSCARELQTMLHHVQSLLFFKYVSNANILMKDHAFYFLHFIEEFSSIIVEFKKTYTSKQKLNFELLIYGKTQLGDHSFILVNIHNMKKLREDVDSLLNTNRFIKLGCIASDYISIMKHYLSSSQNKPSRSDPSLPTFNINDFKFFKDSDCKDDLKFKRSTFIFYQISQSDFFYCSYNIKPEIDEQIKDYLGAIDCWLIQKTKLFSLIKNIKEHNTYEFIHMKNQNSVNVHDPFYKLRKQHSNVVKDKVTISLGLYRLLVNLVFKDLPEKEEKREGGQLEQIKIKYSHHHGQSNELLLILKDTSVDYSKYPIYKGNQKFPLQKLGREYISILRQEYGLHV